MRNPRLRARLLSAIAGLWLGLLAGGCTGSTVTPSGELTVAFTDTASDELTSFEVDVTGITLRKLNGTTVSVLARSTRIDFTQLETLAELIVATGVEAGVYRGLTVTLDFSNAQVWLQGQSTPAAILDQNGVAITGTVNLQVDFPAAIRPRVLQNRRHLFQLDLDLESAVTVDAAANSVTFVPVVAARFDPSNPKPVAATGILVAVDVAARTFVVEKRALDGTPLRRFTVDTDAGTVLQVDGQAALGSAGLAALAQQPLGTARVWVQGTWDASAAALHAVAAEAGAGTFGNGQDWVLGHVVARSASAGSDTTLTVLGHSLDVATGTRLFNTAHQVSVQLGPTHVLRRGAGNALNTDAIEVGQLVLAFGDLTGTSLDATGAGTPGVVRLLPTSVFGVAAGAPVNNVLTIDVTRFDLRGVGSFNFTVGGIVESTPTAYAVDVTGLATGSIAANSRVRCIGWPNAVGVAGDADFRAVAIVDHSAGAKVLLCQWVPADAGAITAATAAGLTLDVTNAAIKVVGDGFAPVVLANSPAPQVAPLAAAGLYAIVQAGTLELNTDWTAFAASLATRLGAGARVFRVSAVGTYAAGPQSFSALLASVILD